MATFTPARDSQADSSLRFNIDRTPASRRSFRGQKPQQRRAAAPTPLDPRADPESAGGAAGMTLTTADLSELCGRFLQDYTGEGEVAVYREAIEAALEARKPCLDVDLAHVLAFNEQLYRNCVAYPARGAEAFDGEVARLILDIRGGEDDGLRLAVRFHNLQEKRGMRDLDPCDVEQLVAVRGIVIRCSELMPEMQWAAFRCSSQDNADKVRCGHLVHEAVREGQVEEPTRCEKCQADHSFELSHNECLFKDKQMLKLQETPESIPEGETPHTVLLYAYEDLFDAVKPGDRVEVTGVYKAAGVRVVPRARNIRAVFRTYIDAVNLKRASDNRVELASEAADKSDEALAPEDIQRLNDLVDQAKLDSPGDESRIGGIYDCLVRSLAPSIWESEDVKKGLLCMLFGGANKHLSAATASRGRFRSDINVLLCGDPSTAKSQFLQYVHKIAPRGVYTSGKGSSAVGLTAYITKDPDTNELVLESGALVLSDRGVCCIDEFDKMDDSTRAILHEAMEQQTVSVAKAGIVCSLNARTAILASANPVGSRYDRSRSVVDNIHLPPTLLSRFDLVYLMLDMSDEKTDRKLARHLTALYCQTRETKKTGPSGLVMAPKELANFISYSRRRFNPKLSDEAADQLVREYVDFRSKGGNSRKTITATPRQLESLVRLSEALAKMEWSDRVEVKHVKEAVRLMQVSLYKSAMNPDTGEIDLSMFITGETSASRERKQKVMDLICAALEGEGSNQLPLSKLRQAVNERLTAEKQDLMDTDGRQGMGELEEALQALDNAGTVQRLRGGKLIKLAEQQGAKGTE